MNMFSRPRSALALVATSGLLLGRLALNPVLFPLLVAAESHGMIWNSVALSDSGEVFVSGPRWTGSQGPALAQLDKDGQPQPYPDARWNAWRPGQDARDVFVNLNGIRRGAGDSLWAIDTGAPDFGGAPLSGGAKVVHIDLKSGRVVRVYPLGSEVATPTSYVDDIRFHGTRGYLTDAGRAGLIVLDLETGEARRVLDNAPSAKGPADRPIVMDGKTVLAPDGSPLQVNTDFLEVSPDGTWLYFASLHGPWFRVERRWVDDAQLSPAALESHVEPWADLPSPPGSAMDTDGTLYFSDLAENALKKRGPDGHIETVLADARLHWVDSPYLAPDGWLWLPASQIDRVALFNGGVSRVERPVRLLRLKVR